MKGQSLVAGLVGLVVVVIVGLAVTFSVAKDIVLEVNATGTERTVVNQIPLLIIVVIILAIVGLMAVR